MCRNLLGQGFRAWRSVLFGVRSAVASQNIAIKLKKLFTEKHIAIFFLQEVRAR